MKDNTPEGKDAERLRRFEKLLSSRSEKERWKGAAELSGYAEKHPELIWGMVVKYGSRNHSDLQMAVATCLLEHVLEYHFKEYFPKVQKMIFSGDRNFRGTLDLCSKFGQASEPANSIIWDKLILKTATAKQKGIIKAYQRSKNRLKGKKVSA